MDTTAIASAARSSPRRSPTCTTAATASAAALPATASTPSTRDHYAFHVMFLSPSARTSRRSSSGPSRSTTAEEVPTPPGREGLATRRSSGATSRTSRGRRHQSEVFLRRGLRRRPRDEDQHRASPDAFVFSGGKDMGVFKGVGFPEDVAEYFRLDEYKGYIWTAHGRFPTNTTRLVGRRASVQHPRLDRRPQRRDLVLRHQPPLPRDARLHLHDAQRSSSGSRRSSCPSWRAAADAGCPGSSGPLR